MGQSKDDRLMSLLDTFLEGHEDELSGMGELGAVPVDYVNDYLASVSDNTESTADNAIRSKSEQLLDAFLASDYKAPVLSSGEDVIRDDADADDDTEQLDESYFTETLARIYLKQHRYDRALEIIKSLYLNFPNKSIYFADQIRYLDKLVRINQKLK